MYGLYYAFIEIGELRLESSEKSIGWRGGAGTAKFPTTNHKAIGADKYDPFNSDKHLQFDFMPKVN